MPSIPAFAGGNATAVPGVIGRSDAALSWPSILAFAAIMLAAMQGTLVMESADPCRISFRKLCILLVLEVLEVAVALASEAFSFTQLHGALTSRLQWLRWIAPCLLFVGFVGIFLDVYYTLFLVAQSRVRWIPFSASGKKPGGKQFFLILEIIALLVSSFSSLCLIRWRQRWWWTANVVSANEAIYAAKHETAISTAAILFSVVWAFTITLGLILLFLVEEGIPYLNGDEDSFFRLVRHVFRPNDWLEKGGSRRVMTRNVDEKTMKSFKLLYRLRLGSWQSCVRDPDEETIVTHLEQAPLHVGNAIVGLDQKSERGLVSLGIGPVQYIDVSVLHALLLVAENLIILPLQICIVTALARLFDKLDEETFGAFKEIVDAVIVVALVEIAVGLKNILWGVGGGSSLHDFDIPLFDRSETES